MVTDIKTRVQSTFENYDIFINNELENIRTINDRITCYKRLKENKKILLKLYEDGEKSIGKFLKILYWDKENEVIEGSEYINIKNISFDFDDDDQEEVITLTGPYVSFRDTNSLKEIAELSSDQKILIKIMEEEHWTEYDFCDEEDFTEAAKAALDIILNEEL